MATASLLPVIGKPAPDFTLPSSSGETVSLKQFKGKKSVVLYFYPKDDTPGCTKEACGFRDLREEFEQLGAVILGGGSFSGGVVSPIGTVVGALTLSIAGSLLSFLNVPPTWQLGAQGAILFLVLAGRVVLAERSP